jgi:parvulin-like peptidyl-prolyl isomerase
MTFRNRPVLDRKHRPRWQDELRTQQLVVAGFAVAIALALGIFGATTWNGYWDAHLRPVASVEGAQVTRSQLTAREAVIGAEIIAQARELEAQLGGPRDTTIQQQIESLSLELNSISEAASDSLVDGAVLASRADEFGVDVSENAIDAEIAERRQLADRRRISLIVVNSLPEEAAPGDEPTEEQIEAARAEAEALLERIEAGEEFAAVATEASDDFSAGSGGDLGWITGTDPTYAEEFSLVDGAEVGDLVGPAQVDGDRGWAILQVVDRRDATEDETLVDLLAESGAGDAAYRAYIRDELLVEAYRGYFESEVAISPQPQRRMAQILINAGQPPFVPQERARHILIQPLPDAQDQTTATEEQWTAALAQAEEVKALVEAPDADWFALANEHSADPGSGSNGGDLGWYDVSAPGFVQEFVDALAALEVNVVSEPVRTQFGYHVIQKTGERTSPPAQAAELVDQLRDDPEAFGEIATQVSEDYGTARTNGELGWVARYQLDERQENAIFALTEIEAISEPLDLGTEGIYIFQLLEIAESREIEESRLTDIRETGFERWLEQEVKADVPVWVDPQFAPSTSTA